MDRSIWHGPLIAVTKYHELICHRNLFLIFLRAGKFKINTPTNLISADGSLLYMVRIWNVTQRHVCQPLVRDGRTFRRWNLWGKIRGHWAGDTTEGDIKTLVPPLSLCFWTTRETNITTTIYYLTTGQSNRVYQAHTGNVETGAKQDLSSIKVISSDSRMVFLMCPHVIGETKKLPGASLIRVLVSMKVLSSWSDHFPKGFTS